MSTQEELKQLSLPSYWNEKYARGDEHEWISFYFHDLYPIFEEIFPPAASQPRLLHLGCGTSVGISWIFTSDLGSRYA